MRWSVLSLLVALACAFPSSSLAATRFVANGGLDNTDCTSSGAPCATVSHATEVAANGDTIQIAAGVYNESVQTGKVLTFVGAGAGTLGGIPAATLIRGPAGSSSSGSPALVLPNGGTVKSLRAQGGQGDNAAEISGFNGGEGIVYHSGAPGASALRLEDAVVVGGAGGNGAIVPGGGGVGIDAESGPGGVAFTSEGSEFAGGSGFGGAGAVWVSGQGATATLLDSRLGDVGPAGSGITGFNGAAVTLESVDVDVARPAATIYEGTMRIVRSRLEGGFALSVETSSGDHASVDLIDSLATSTEAVAADIDAEGAGSSSILNAQGSTLIAFGGIAAVRALRREGADAATATLRNSIARHLPSAGKPNFDLFADGGRIDADFSSFTTRVEENGGIVSAPGSAGNVAGDPLLADPSRGDFAPAPASPLIDRGDPGIAGAGELDLAGSPRSLDGNLDCVAAPDIGAFEVTGQSATCPDARPVVSRFGMTNRAFAPKGGRRSKRAHGSARGKRVKHGTKFTYTLSEPARVKIAIERRAPKRRKGGRRFAKATTLTSRKGAGRQSTSFSGRVRGRGLKPGRYRATIVATDGAGQTSAPRRINFRILR
ncbi:MAG TPA: hypothetical protein VGF04_08000 [Solirubrobacterales bacterium]|jgi:hypothetical protein